MCRLYGLLASEPTKVECSLVHAQNALMVQSKKDRSGYSHAHGWGVATYEDHEPHVERQAWAAYHGEHFQRAAARIYSRAVLGHVRRATVGPPALENTHPFFHGHWAMIHNGTIPGFERIRDRMREAMSPEHLASIAGVTDSEHLFRLFASDHEAQLERPALDVLRRVIRKVLDWSQDAAPVSDAGLNVILTDGEHMIGTCWGRSLHYVERDGVSDCEICGFPHVRHELGQIYRAVVLASEPITHEAWLDVPNGSVFSVTPDLRLCVEPL